MLLSCFNYLSVLQHPSIYDDIRELISHSLGSPQHPAKSVKGAHQGTQGLIVALHAP